MMQEYIEDNKALREEIARAHAVLDKAGIPEPGLRFSERITMLVARERRLRDETARMRAAMEGALACRDGTNRWQRILRAALAPEEPRE